MGLLDRIPMMGNRRNEPPSRYDMRASRADLGDIYMRDFRREPAPIVSLSVGSAGMNRTAKWVQKMVAMDCAHRIQSLFVYDCNAKNVREWRRAASQSRMDHLCITPKELPLPDGFMREPNFYMEYYGSIARDVERMVDEMERQANEAGMVPQIILEWLGFGGHAKLAYLVHEKVSARFPTTKFLPIYCFPSERVLEANIRDYDLWEEAEAIIGTGAAIITDNRAAGSVDTIDERVAVALAAIEGCFRFKPEVGSIGETISMLNQDGARWLGIDVTDLPYRRHHESRNPMRRRATEDDEYLSHSSLVHSIKETIWRIADPENDEHHTADFIRPGWDAQQRIYVLLPFHREAVEYIKADVEDQLSRETFSGAWPGTTVAFAPANTQWRHHDRFNYGHVCKLTGMPREPMPPTIERILADTEYMGRRSRVLSRGEALMKERGLELQARTASKASSGRNLASRLGESLIIEEDEPKRDPAATTFTEKNLGNGTGELLDAEEMVPA